MRRMITEMDSAKVDAVNAADLSKLNKITDEDIAKLNSITDADVQSVKAMESSKNAAAGTVLTADGAGKAVYKTPAPASGGTNIMYKSIIFRTEIQHDEKKGYFAEMVVPNAKHIVSLHYNPAAPDGGTYYIYVGGIEPAIPYSEVQWTSIPSPSGTSSTITMLIPEATKNKYNLPVGPDSEITTNIGYCYYND